MPLIHKEERNDGTLLAIWQIKESEEELGRIYSDLSLPLESTDNMLTFKVALKRKQWYASRLLSAECIADFKGIYYDQFGAPHLHESDMCVSYSHSHDRVALFLHPDFEVGVDIQKKDVKLKRIANKFMNKEEQGRFTEFGSRLDELHILWSAKEAVFKIHKHHLPFKKIKTEPFQLAKKGVLHVQADRFDGPHDHDLEYELHDDFCLVSTCYGDR